MEIGNMRKNERIDPVRYGRWVGLLVAGVCLLIGGAWNPCPVLGAGSGTTAERWEAAAEAYRTKDFEQARQIYEGLLNEVSGQGRPHPELCYNLGNVYFQLGAKGRAAWMYEKTLAAAPRHADARKNLALVRGGGANGEPESFFLFKPLAWLAQRYTAGEWSVPFLFFYGLAAIAGIVWILRRRGGRLWRVSRWVCLLASGLTLLFGAFFVPSYLQSEFHIRAVVLDSSVPVRVAPGADQDVYFEMQESERLEVTSEAGIAGWLRVKRPADGRVGFLPENTVGIL
jgi:hypothetical protein